MPIASFKDGRLERMFAEQFPGKRFPAELIGVTTRKLSMISAAKRPEDLRWPPGNRFEALKGDRAGFYSIRVNDQFRLCFGWSSAGATDVEFLDYH